MILHFIYNMIQSKCDTVLKQYKYKLTKLQCHELITNIHTYFFKTPQQDNSQPNHLNHHSNQPHHLKHPSYEPML